MHFHLPKPLHGWREFTGEVGIIVIGVLIALAAEAVVEDLRWHERVRTSLNSLGPQIEEDYFNAAELVVTQPCIDGQLEQIERVLSQQTGGWRPLPAYGDDAQRFAIRTPSRNWSGDVWRSMNSDGTAAHLSRSLRLRLAGYYEQTAAIADYQMQATKLSWRLAAVTQKLGPGVGERFRMIGDIEELRGNFHLMKTIGNQLLGQVEAIGIGKANPKTLGEDLVQYSGTVRFCRAHHLPLGRMEPVPAVEPQ